MHCRWRTGAEAYLGPRLEPMIIASIPALVKFWPLMHQLVGSSNAAGPELPPA